ncbi:MAG: MFS transporter [Eubacteriales bacterium]
MVLALLSGVLSSRFSQKSLAIISVFLYVIGGCIFGFGGGTVPFGFLIFANLCIGGATGIALTTYNSLFSKYLPNDKVARFQGYIPVATGAGSVLFLTGGGLLAAKFGWQYAYLTFILFAVSLLCIFLFFPNDKPVAEKEKTGEKSTKWYQLPIKSILLSLLGTFSFGFFYSLYNASISRYIVGSGLGDAAITGMITNIIVLVGIVAGLAFGYMFKWAKGQLITLSYLLVGAGFLLFVLFPSLPVMFVGAIIVGLGFTMMLPAVIVSIKNVTSPTERTMAVAVCVTLLQFGLYLSSLTLIPLSKALYNSSPSGNFIVGGVAMLILAVISLFTIGKFGGEAPKEDKVEINKGS